MKKLFLATIETTSSFACDVTKFKTLGGIRVSATAFELAEDTDGQTRAKLTFTPLLNVDGFQMVPFTEGKTVTLVDFENDGVGTGETDVVVKTCTSSYFTFDHSGPIPTKMGEVFTSNFPFIATSDFLLRRTSGVTIDLEEAGITWGQAQAYTIDFTEGFVIDPNDDGFASPASTIAYTSNSTAPIIASSEPGNASIDVVNNTTIALTYTRVVKPGTGYIKLYKQDNTLVKAFDVTNFAEVSFFNKTVTVKTKGLMAKNTSYYIKTDATAIKDLETIYALALNAPNEFYFTTADAAFPDLSAAMSTTTACSATAKVILAADRFLTRAEGDTPYIEDAVNNILYAPQVSDYSYDGSGTYTVTVTPSTTAAVETMTTTATGGTRSFNSTTKVLTLTGNRDQVNNHLNSIRLDAGVDYDQAFTLSYTVVTPRSSTMTKVQNVVLSNIKDYELFRVVGYDRKYYANQSNLFWATEWVDGPNTQLVADHPGDYQPFVSDIDAVNGFGVTEPYTSITGNLWDGTNYTGNYTLELSSTSGTFSSLVDDSDETATWSYTGTKSQIDLKFPAIKFWPNPGVAVDTPINIVFKKGSITTLSTSITLKCVGVNNITETITYNSSGTWTPTALQVRYGQLDYLIVGGGGAGGNLGGGGGGGFKELLGQTGFSVGTYAITVGSAGVGNQTSQAGSAGGNSSAFGYTAFGGASATWATVSPFPRAGVSGIPTTAGVGTIYQGGFPSYTYNSYAVTGGGGGGGSAGAGSNSSTSSGAGGGGGLGYLSAITNQRYGGGGGGRGINHDTTVTGWNGGNGGSGGSSVGGRGSTLTTTSTSPYISTFATAGTNGSGGGGGIVSGSPSSPVYGGGGGSGVVVVRVRSL